MNDESRKFRNIDGAGRQGEKGDAHACSKGNAQTIGKTREAARNWGWAHASDSYDWMDSHSPFSSAD